MGEVLFTLLAWTLLAFVGIVGYAVIKAFDYTAKCDMQGQYHE
jgi:hypothetical protein